MRIKQEVRDIEVTLDKASAVSSDFMCLSEKDEHYVLFAINHEPGRGWSYALPDGGNSHR